MAPPTLVPFVDHTQVVLADVEGTVILVGSAAWYAWLLDVSSFAFRSDHGSFTAHKERRSPAREYWKAYRHRDGQLRRVYLGKSAELTLERLTAAAVQLAGGGSDVAPGKVARDATWEATTTGTDDPTRPAQPIIVQTIPHQAERGTTSAQLPPTSPMSDDPRPHHLLTTKLVVPAARPIVVPRLRLAAQLDAALAQHHKLILLCAPAGFGKTTMLTTWLTAVNATHGRVATRPIPMPPAGTDRAHVDVAWLALDDDDNHLEQFLAYFIAALEIVRPGIGTDAWGLLRSQVDHPPAQAILTSLINALTDVPARLVLALDDYHTITQQAIHAAVAFWLEHIPSHVHVVITTRADPPFSLARLRVRRQLTEVRVADLRFTHDEAADFFDQVHGIRLTAAAVATLETSIEGWAAGLQLAALSLQDQDPAQIAAFIADFNGSHPSVFDYLADEVFQRQPSHVQAFLMQTAILARLCSPVCDVVTGQHDTQAMLEQLDQANLFLIQLDRRRHWYRYHHLFRDFLCNRLERMVGAEPHAMLHRRASAWFEQQGLMGEAIEHALSAYAWDAALRCIAPLMVNERLYDYFLDWPRWLAALPDPILQAQPELCLRFAWILGISGHAAATERPLKLAAAAFKDARDQVGCGAVLALRSVALYLQYDFAQAIHVAEQALAVLPVDALEHRRIATYMLGVNQIELGHVRLAAELLAGATLTGQDVSEFIILLTGAMGRAVADQLQGHLQAAAALHQAVIQRMGHAPHLQVPAASIYLGLIAYEWNDLAVAEQILREGIVVGQRIGRRRSWPFAYRSLARVLWAQGATAQATTVLMQALAAAQLLQSPREIADVQAQQAGQWLAQDDLPAAVRWLTLRAISITDELPYERLADYLMLARIRIAQAQQIPGSADLPAVVRLLAQLREAAETDQRLTDQITMLALLALAHAAQGNRSEALAALGAALHLAEPAGYIRTFVDEGPVLRGLLVQYRDQLGQRLPSDDRLLRYSARLLAAYPTVVQSSSTTIQPAELLSERERTVLQLLARGHSAQVIAAHLIISVHTTRTHIKNIYTKLDAHTRLQAVERARALQLL